jgi:hypothetical protein
MLGIDLESGSDLVFQGVSGVREVAYMHRIILAAGLSSISLDVGFTDSMAVGTGLLGQHGFFEQFHISFRLREKFFEVIEAQRER